MSNEETYQKITVIVEDDARSQTFIVPKAKDFINFESGDWDVFGHKKTKFHLSFEALFDKESNTSYSIVEGNKRETGSGENSSEVVEWFGGVGWYEFVRLTTRTIHIAYVRGDGSIYIPEEGVSHDDFLSSKQAGRVHKLARKVND